MEQLEDLTYWLTYRKFATDDYVMDMQAVKDLYHKPHAWPGLRQDLTAQQTIVLKLPVLNNLWIVSLTGKSTPAPAVGPGFSFQMLNSREKRALSRTHLDDVNALGIGKQKTYFRYPPYLRAGTILMIQLKNMTAGALTAELVMECVLNQQHLTDVVPYQPQTRESGLQFPGQNDNEQPAPWLKMPPDGVPFWPSAYVALPAQGATATVVSFKVPPGRNGVINWLGYNIVAGGWNEGTGDAIFQVTADTVPIQNAENLLGALGSADQPQQVPGLRIYEGQTIAITVKNVNLAPGGLVGGRMIGWHYDIADESPAAFGQ